jgi:hypothetical protein
MDVTKLKKNGDVYHIEYIENLDGKSLVTEDEPETELVTAMDNVALAALTLFEISDFPCKLQSIEYKDGEHAGTKCMLVSEEKSVFGKIKIALPKVSTQDAETPEEGIYDPENLKNQYNRAVDALRDQVKRFLQGARRQRPLPFPEEETPKKKRKGIIGAVADKAAGLFG